MSNVNLFARVHSFVGFSFHSVFFFWILHICRYFGIICVWQLCPWSSKILSFRSDVVCGEKSSFLRLSIWSATVSSSPNFVLRGFIMFETQWQSCPELITTLVRLWFISRPGGNYHWFIVSTPGCWYVTSHDPVNISTETSRLLHTVVKVSSENESYISHVFRH